LWDCRGNDLMNAPRSACCEKKSCSEGVDTAENMAGSELWSCRANLRT
jgi:hypothetical protein